MGVDVVIGNTQRFGVPIGYGGPHAAYMSIKKNINALCPEELLVLRLIRKVG